MNGHLRKLAKKYFVVKATIVGNTDKSICNM